MNTLLITPEIFSGKGGIPRILRLYLKALCEIAESGGSVKLLALNDGQFDSRDLRRYSNPRLVEWQTCHQQKRFFRREALRLSANTDLIVCGHIDQLRTAWLARQWRRRKLHYTLIAHGREVCRPFGFWDKRALLGAARIWCVSDYVRREFLRFLPQAAGRAVVLPNALDPFFEIKPAQTPATDMDILTIAGLDAADRAKGIDYLIAAMGAIVQEIPAARLRVVGSGDDLARLQALSHEHRVSHAVKFLGQLNDEDLKRELDACRLFALPSQQEGFGLVYLEAMARGKPCLAMRESGAREIVAPETGVLADQVSAPLIATACVEALRRVWDAPAIARHAQKFSYPQFGSRLAQAIPLPA